MSYTFETYQTALAQLMVVDSVEETNFVSILPSIIDYAEQRIYRELDLLSAKTTVSNLATALKVRTMALPSQPTFITVENVVITGSITEYQQTYTDRRSVLPVSRDLLDAVYANNWTPGTPQWFAMQDNATLIWGPWPDAVYTVEVTGTARPAPLSSSNDTTFLSKVLPDLFMAASMIFAAGYQKNFGSQADDPQAAMSWEEQYGKLLQSAIAEEARKKFQSSGWTSLSAPAAATPTR